MGAVLSFPTFLGFVLAVLVCVKAEPLSKALGVVDTPDPVGGRKRHQFPTPLVGGLAVLAGVAPVLFWSGFVEVQEVHLTLFGLAGGFGLLGFLDDRNHMQPIVRLAIGAIMVAVAVRFVGDFGVTYLKFSFLPISLNLNEWAIVFTLICVVGFQNAINMADGKNGLVVGLSIIWSALLLAFAPAELQPLLFLFIGCLSVVLAFNMRGKLFLGDTGSYSLSVLVAALTIYTYNNAAQQFPADMIALWFLIPVVDCLRLIISRVMRNRSPFHADRDHLHHHISYLFGWSSGLWLYLGMVGVPGAISLIAPALTPLLIIVSLLAYSLVWHLARRNEVSRIA